MLGIAELVCGHRETAAPAYGMMPTCLQVPLNTKPVSSSGTTRRMGTTNPNMLTIDHRFFFNTARKAFGPFRQDQVDGFNVLLSAIEERSSSIAEAAYFLATAWHETAFTMQPVRETLASSDEDAIARLEFAWTHGRLTSVKNPYWRMDAQGKAWFGRGYVQLTHKPNYVRMGERLGVNLAENPGLAMVPSIAADILIVGCQDGLFTGRRMSEFVTSSKRDYVSARRVVNGLDKARQIAEYAKGFEKAIRV